MGATRAGQARWLMALALMVASVGVGVVTTTPQAAQAATIAVTCAPSP